MTLDDHVESRCDTCETPLVQLDGDWFCPECNADDKFSLVPDQDEFAL
jgi:uncharacterized Zn finger protein (UPF0148 family)